MDKKLQKTINILFIYILASGCMAFGEEVIIEWRHSIEKSDILEKNRLVLYLTNLSGQDFWFAHSDIGPRSSELKLAYVDKDELKQLYRSRLSYQEFVLFRKKLAAKDTIKVELPLGFMFSSLESVGEFPYAIFYTFNVDIYGSGDPFSEEAPIETLYLKGVVSSSETRSEPHKPTKAR